MSNSPVQIQCSNPTCLHPANHLGQHLCDRCQMPLVYRHVWAIGEKVVDIPVNTLIGDRYLVKQPQIWLDTKPGSRPDTPDVFPRRILPYLHLYADRLHLPELYGSYLHGDQLVFLLNNVPISETGELQSTLETAWTKAPSVRQVYWLWQLLQLWQPLKGQQVATSLLASNNIFVEGWRVRLLELLPDYKETEKVDDTDIPTAIPSSAASGNRGFAPDELAETATGADESELEFNLTEEESEPVESATPTELTLRDLARVWQPWIEATHPTLQGRLQGICQLMQTLDDTPLGRQSIAAALNQLLLELSAQTSLKVQVSGATTTGPQRAHNEDACYPDRQIRANDSLVPGVGIICDGIGGHEGGEVASQLALAQLKPLLSNLLQEFQERTDLAMPQEVEQDLESIVRVVNGAIAKQNDDQKRALRQRMGTTLVMALQLPQVVSTDSGMSHAHELYLVHVGDSRAYWLTPNYCHPLTLDDDVATREVKLGRSLYQEALNRPDGGALTQALGTRDSDALHPTVKRLIIEESGILLLCSDGLSDNDRVEQTWMQIADSIFNGKMALEDAVQAWIQLADDYNGHDNTSVVMMRFQVGNPPELPKVEPETALPFQPLPPPTSPLLAPPPVPSPPAPIESSAVPPVSEQSDSTVTDHPSNDREDEPFPQEEELTEASKALLYGEEEDSEEEDELTLDEEILFEPPSRTASQTTLPQELLERPKLPSTWFWLAALIGVTLLAGTLGFLIWSSLLERTSLEDEPIPLPPTESPQ